LTSLSIANVPSRERIKRPFPEAKIRTGLKGFASPPDERISQARLRLRAGVQLQERQAIIALHFRQGSKAPMTLVTGRLSRKNQIVVPRKAREVLRLQAGDQVQFVIDGHEQRVYLQGKPTTYTERYFGIARGLLPDTEVNTWLDNLRQEWDQRALPSLSARARKSR